MSEAHGRMTESASRPSLPEPDEAASAHSIALRQLLSDRIDAAGGVISFADYMSQTLYEPGLGYYSAGAAKFGADGDFITAPEVSPLFGAALAGQITQILTQNGGGVLELGAGSGKLAASILLENSADMPVNYDILEPSAALIQRQKQYLQSRLSPGQFARIRWLDRLPAQFNGIILANEVMDALPVERFRIGDTLEQLYVSSALNNVYAGATPALIQAVSTLESDLGRSLETGYQSELSLLLQPWISSLANSLSQGVLLLIDYGYPRQEYYLEERIHGTLTCYYRHRAHDDPYWYPGLQDITAHVDFTAVAEAGCANNLNLLGYASQSAFLLDNHLLDLAEKAMAAQNSEADRIVIARAVKTLTLPGEMGERFQVIAFGKGYDHPLQGFASQDLTYRL